MDARRWARWVGTLLLVWSLGQGPGSSTAVAAEAPAWMHAQVNATLPVYNERTEAVLLYSETILSVQPNGKIKRLDRRAYKILRPDGEKRGTVPAVFGAESRITALRGWCIPVQGKDYEVKQKDAVETAVGVDGGELVSDVRLLVLHIPAATPGGMPPCPPCTFRESPRNAGHWSARRRPRWRAPPGRARPTARARDGGSH